MQGQEDSPRYLSTRMVFIMMMLTRVVLFENFSASYTFFLTEMGQLLYYGKVVITWKKNSPYGPLFNYL